MKTPRDDGLHVVAKDGALTPTPFFILPCVAFPTHHVVSSPPFFSLTGGTTKKAQRDAGELETKGRPPRPGSVALLFHFLKPLKEGVGSFPDGLDNFAIPGSLMAGKESVQLRGHEEKNWEGHTRSVSL